MNPYSRRAFLGVLAAAGAAVAGTVGWAVWGSRESGSPSPPTVPRLVAPPAVPSVPCLLQPAALQPAALPDLDPEASRMGAQYFREAVEWLGAPGPDRTRPMRSTFWEVNAKLEFEGRDAEGAFRLWMEGRDAVRVDLAIPGKTQSTWFLGDATWLRHEEALIAVPPDDERLSVARCVMQIWNSLSSIVHLGDLQTSDTRFDFKGATEGTGTYAGKWLKVIRHAPTQPQMTFWFAYEKDPDGTLHPQHPGIVRLHSLDPAGWQTDFILQDWQRDADPRPRKIKGYRVPRSGPARRFLFALVRDFKVNRDVSDALQLK